MKVSQHEQYSLWLYYLYTITLTCSSRELYHNDIWRDEWIGSKEKELVSK